MTSPQPYTISVPDAATEKLKRKLSNADNPDEPDTPMQWPYGSPKTIKSERRGGGSEVDALERSTCWKML